MTKKTGIFLALSLAVIMVMGPTPVFAAVGDVVHVTDLSGFISSPPVHCSIGIATDDEPTPNGYTDDCSSNNIYRFNLITGALIETLDLSADIPEGPNAIAFDASRDGLWICTQSTDGLGSMPIYFQDFQGTRGDMTDDTVTKVFSITSPPADFSFGFCDGLAINLNGPGPADDRIYFSDDINDKTAIYDVTGTFISEIDNLLIDPTLSTGSGLAVGGKFLYLANDGGGDVFRADLSSNPLQPPLVDQFTSGDDRQEDMECDPITFSPIDVMWVRTTPQSGAFPNVVTAYEIEPKTCGVGGTDPDPDPDDPVAGELLPLDTTSLFVSGFIGNLLVIVPIAAAGITGAGIYIARNRVN